MTREELPQTPIGANDGGFEAAPDQASSSR
jgi:hypothetical protein